MDDGRVGCRAHDHCKHFNDVEIVLFLPYGTLSASSTLGVTIPLAVASSNRGSVSAQYSFPEAGLPELRT